jgi:catechol 2,3-dioxygenase-like lactoylglutathione lyase family enzyme
MTVADVERSRKFYGEVLGLREEPPMQITGGQVSVRYGFQWGTTTVKFWQLPGELPVHTGAPNTRAGIRYFTAMVEDIEAAEAELTAKGVTIAMPKTELPGVAKLLFIADPDGNWIELAQLIK